jgi:thymidylate synthase (FAD)
VITIKGLGHNIFGTGIEQFLATSDKFPKLQVTLYNAPPSPEKIIAYSYLECIENRNLMSPAEIPIPEAKKITEWVLKGGHTPALESLHILFNIRGMSKVVSHQIVRHRIGVSIDQRTQRANSQEFLGKFYHGKHYITPPDLRRLMNENEHLEELYEDFMAQAEGLYDSFLEAGASEDDARYCIPQASETAMNFKVIFKALLDSVCSTRLCELMQGELVEIVKMMQKLTAKYDANLGKWLVPKCFKTGSCNRNENNPTDDHPKGVCIHTKAGSIPVRDRDDTFDLTKYSRSASKV